MTPGKITGKRSNRGVVLDLGDLSYVMTRVCSCYLSNQLVVGRPTCPKEVCVLRVGSRDGFGNRADFSLGIAKVSVGFCRCFRCGLAPFQLTGAFLVFRNTDLNSAPSRLTHRILIQMNGMRNAGGIGFRVQPASKNPSCETTLRVRSYNGF